MEEKKNFKKRFYQKGWFIILTYLLLCPIGVFLMWKNKRFHTIIRIGLTLAAIYVTIFDFVVISSIVNPGMYNNINASNASSTKGTETAQASSDNSKTKSTEANKVSSENAENKSSKDTNKTTEAQSKSYDFGKEKSKLDNFSKEVKNGKYEVKYLTLEKNLFSKDNYKLSLQRADYMYMGELKESLPDGKGVLLKNFNDIYYVYYAGDFKDGCFDGFGVMSGETNDDYKDFGTFSNVPLTYNKYEGYFKDGEFSGKGNLELASIGANFNLKEGTNFNKIKEYMKQYEKEIEDLENKKSQDRFTVSNLPQMESYIGSSGNFKDGKLNGEGYNFFEDGSVEYIGNFKDDEYDGKGILYWPDGNKLYEGNFSHGEYDGKGTLYKKNGDVEYKGKWSNGDID